MTETIDIVKDIVSNMNLQLNIKTVSSEDNLHTITVCNTYYLAKDNIIEIDSNSFTIVSVIDSEIVLSGDVAPTVGKFTIANPFFFHGTITQTNNELSQITDCFEKYPAIYLRRTFVENWSRTSEIEREAQLTLYFLTQANFEQWQTENFDEYAIKPMRKLCYSFIDKINNNRQLHKSNDWSITDNIKFATFVTDKGYENQKFNDTLSGVQLDITLKIKKNYKCNC